jgi:hypothetical protein
MCMPGRSLHRRNACLRLADLSACESPSREVSVPRLASKTLPGAPCSCLGRFQRIVSEAEVDAAFKDVFKLAIVLIATMTALVLGLVISSARSASTRRLWAPRTAPPHSCVLDRLLGRYGPETTEVRDLFQRAWTHRVNSIWPEDVASSANLDDPAMARTFELLEDMIHLGD